MAVAPKISTERLTLRQVEAEDATDVFSYTLNPGALRYTTGVTPTSIHETRRFIDRLLKKPKDAYAWAILVEDDPKVSGILEFAANKEFGTVDYGLAVEYWNRGYMTEAVKAVMEWAFSAYPDLQNITASAMAVNSASIRVLEKCGMEFESRRLDQWEKFKKPIELVRYSIARELAKQSHQTAPANADKPPG